MNDDNTIRLDLPGNGRHLGVLQPCVEEMLGDAPVEGDRDALIMQVHLAVHELCSNIVHHAYGEDGTGRILVTFSLLTNPARLLVVTHDSGARFDPASAREPLRDVAQIRGYGLFIVREVMDEVVYEASPGGNSWRLTKLLDGDRGTQ